MKENIDELTQEDYVKQRGLRFDFGFYIQKGKMTLEPGTQPLLT